jgi:hypothetical protein
MRLQQEGERKLFDFVIAVSSVIVKWLNVASKLAVCGAVQCGAAAAAGAAS